MKSIEVENAILMLSCDIGKISHKRGSSLINTVIKQKEGKIPVHVFGFRALICLNLINIFSLYIFPLLPRKAMSFEGLCYCANLPGSRRPAFRRWIKKSDMFKAERLSRRKNGKPQIEVLAFRKKSKNNLSSENKRRLSPNMLIYTLNPVIIESIDKSDKQFQSVIGKGVKERYNYAIENMCSKIRSAKNYNEMIKWLAENMLLCWGNLNSLLLSDGHQIDPEIYKKFNTLWSNCLHN